MDEAFYIPEADDRFIATGWTTGPWNKQSQHGGPPAALLGLAIERLTVREQMQVARIAFDILRPIPVSRVDVRAQVIRPGHNVLLSSAALLHDGEPVMVARAWSIRINQLDLTDVAHGDVSALPSADTPKEELFPTDDVSYISGMQWRFVDGDFLSKGPATVWMRMRFPLVQGEETSPLSRFLIAVDSGNGVSSELDFGRWIYINPEFTAHLHRLPLGEWICLAARTTARATGIGLAESTVYDEMGNVGRASQALFIADRHYDS